MQGLFTTEAQANVRYLGSVPYENIKKHIDEAAVCVFPTFAEALPVSWIEAMAMQKAIVASAIGWAEEVIEEMAAFPNSDHDDFVDSASQALIRYRKGGFIPLQTDEQDEPVNFRRKAAYY